PSAPKCRKVHCPCIEGRVTFNPASPLNEVQQTSGHPPNTAESFFSILKRGITGTYHSVSEAHLHRYLSEFDFRHNNRSALGIEDAERAAKALKGAEGKRLTYRQPAIQFAA
ncbi:transposase, partial [Aurantimonas sp. E1-2-R+4]|uniref:transposase n=1 Tax=Aurantimonas sp. E1-2-R+4 TaxID=3113714 RepID=UPI002F923289